MSDLHDQLLEEARLTEYLGRKCRERRERRRLQAAPRATTKARNKSPGRRAKVTPAMVWLRSLTCPLVYGELTPDGVRPSNTIKQLQSRWNLDGPLRKLTNYQFDDHFRRAGTYYFFGNGSPKAGRTLVMIDIDVQKSLGLGTTAGAVAFAAHLKHTHWPDLYFEPSTGGNGIHAYIVVEKLGADAVAVNSALKRLQDWLRAEAKLVKADIELVEVKGTCPVIQFRYRFMHSVRYGTFAKLPRDVTRFPEWESTTVLRIADLQSGRFDVPDEVVEPSASIVSTRPGKKVKTTPGSVSGKLISEEELAAIPKYEAFAGELTGGTTLMARRWKVTDHDFAVVLLLLRFFHANPNPDGSLPTARAEGMWTGLYSAGDVQRPWNHHRWEAVRNFLSAEGHINWIDHRYEYGRTVEGRYVKGVACKFTITEAFAAALERITSVSTTVAGSPGGASFVGTAINAIKKLVPKRGAGRFLVPTRFPIRAENERFMLKRAFEACEHLCAA